jgi:hypothetical protein
VGKFSVRIIFVIFCGGARLLHLMQFLRYGIFVCPIVEASGYQLITESKEEVVLLFELFCVYHQVYPSCSVTLKTPNIRCR